jgi:hypothetical protein
MEGACLPAGDVRAVYALGWREKIEQTRYLEIAFDRGPSREVGRNRVRAAVSGALTTEVPRLFEVADDLLGRPSGDFEQRRKILQPNSWLAGDHDQCVRVIR